MNVASSCKRHAYDQGTDGRRHGVNERHVKRSPGKAPTNGFSDAAVIEAERVGMERAFGVGVRYCSADMAKGDAVAEMIGEAEKAFGAVDILVNNAGIRHVAPIEDFPTEAWDSILAVNLSWSSVKSPTRCRRAA